VDEEIDEEVDREVYWILYSQENSIRKCSRVRVSDTMRVHPVVNVRRIVKY